jgi:hypothetical protein
MNLEHVTTHSQTSHVGTAFSGGDEIFSAYLGILRPAVIADHRHIRVSGGGVARFVAWLALRKKAC